MSTDGKLVYSTDPALMQKCARCKELTRNCTCPAPESKPFGKRQTVILRMEKKGRGGKTVTVLDGLPRHADYLRDLASQLKRRCGTGGTAGDGCVELQGDFRDKLRPLLTSMGFLVKG